MSKTFSEHERVVIRQNLINACKECWNRYGYQKTGIRELAEMAGISSGALYQFFASKELLFVETANTYEKEMVAVFHANMEKSPDKHGIAESLKAIVALMADMPWLSSMYEEWSVILRKLPPDYMQQDFRKDVNRIGEIAEQYQLKPRRSMEEVTRIIDILLTSVVKVDFVPGDNGESLNFIIDAVVAKLFE